MKNNLKNNITIRYMLALSLVALLSISAFYALRLALKDSESLAYIVNISGKQRMLSQHLALDIHKLYLLKEQGCKDARYQNVKKTLIKNANEMIKANKALSTGVFTSYEDTTLSKEIHELYFGSSNVAKRVDNYANLAIEATTVDSLDDLKKTLEKISLESEPLLAELNKIVQQYQIEGERDIALIKNIETGIMSFTLFILVLEVLFIFQPMANHIVKISDEKNNLLEELQQKVNTRTKHLEEANKRLKELAFYDPLTGLRNRITLERDIEELILRTRNDEICQFAFLMLDIDHFKDLNDTYGHDFGDHALKVFAKIFKNSFRDNDSIYRVGGEEFAVVLKRISLQDSIKAANLCRKKISEHEFHIDNKSFNKTISIGVYHSSQNNTTTFKKIYKSADSALYKAKEGGRDRVELFNDKE